MTPEPRGRCAQCGGQFDHGKALARLVAERLEMDGTLIGNAQQPFRFAEWIRGVNDGRADAAKTRGKEQSGVLL